MPKNISKKSITSLTKLKHETLINFVRTSVFLDQKLQGFLDEFDLTAQQFNFLRILRGAAPEALCLKEVKERLVDRNSDVSRLVKRLEAKEYIVKVPRQEDKRHSLLSLSEKGCSILAQIDVKDPFYPASSLDHISEEKLKIWNEITDLMRVTVKT